MSPWCLPPGALVWDFSWKHSKNQNCWVKGNLINFIRIQIYLIQCGCSIYTPFPPQQSLGFPVSPPLSQNLILSDVSNGIFSSGFSFPWLLVCMSCFSYTCWPLGILTLYCLLIFFTVFSIGLCLFFSLFFNGRQNELQRKQALTLLYLSLKGIKKNKSWKKDFMRFILV